MNKAAPVILIVDDNQVSRGVLVELFSNRGFEVVSKGDPKGALAYINDHRPDIIISDYVMPGMTGLELAGEAFSLYEGIPFMLVTGLEERDINNLKIADNIVTIQKPFELIKILELVNEMIAA
jgi:two-component system, OmpR family, response regulator VicR